MKPVKKQVRNHIWDNGRDMGKCYHGLVYLKLKILVAEQVEPVFVYVDNEVMHEVYKETSL